MKRVSTLHFQNKLVSQMWHGQRLRSERPEEDICGDPLPKMQTGMHSCAPRFGSGGRRLLAGETGFMSPSFFGFGPSGGSSTEALGRFGFAEPSVRMLHRAFDIPAVP